MINRNRVINLLNAFKQQEKERQEYPDIIQEKWEHVKAVLDDFINNCQPIVIYDKTCGSSIKVDSRYDIIFDDILHEILIFQKSIDNNMI